MPVQLEVFLQFSFSNIDIIHVVSFVQETLEKRLSSYQNVWFCYCTEINLTRNLMLCTQNNVFVVDEESRGLGIVSLCVPGGGE